MSSHLISVFGIVGASGAHIAGQFDRWKKRATASSGIKISEVRKFERLFVQLSSHATIPPVAFFRSHAETWLFPDMLLENAFGKERKPYEKICFGTESESWAIYVGIRACRRFVPRWKANRGQSWFFPALLDCMESMDWMQSGVLIIHFQCFGLSVDDEEMKQSMKTVAPWIKR